MNPLLRSVLFSLATFTILICLLIFASPKHKQHVSEKGAPHVTFGSFFSFSDPASLFFPSASISLTDDNSTSFNAKPAAFGPPLPDEGLSGPVWTGKGFRKVSNHLRRGSLTTEGELGCGDVPSWIDDDFMVDESDASAVESSLSDSKEGISRRDKSSHSSKQYIEIHGKIALLSRGGCGFSEKIQWAQRRGAAAVIVGDNVPGNPLIRMYPRGDTSNITIPSIFTSHTTAHLLASLVPLDSSNTLFDPLTISRNSNIQAQQLRASKGETTSSSEPSEPSRTTLPEPRLPHEGLWVTLHLTDINASPFFNTLFVLVVSPLITLAIVYSMLLLRSRIRRRRWRAPKSVVERLPVHIYRTVSSRASINEEAQSRSECDATTPLLGGSRPSDVRRPSPTVMSGASLLSATPTSIYGSIESSTADQEKADAGLSEWRRKYGAKQKECVVCLDEYIDGVSKVMSLPCGHEFHADCITPWLTTRRRTCPICKGDVVRSIDRISNSSYQRVTDESEDDVQIQAAERRNLSPSAAFPIPQAERSTSPALDRTINSVSSFSDLGSPPPWMRDENNEQTDNRR